MAIMHDYPVHGEISGKVLSLEPSSWGGANGAFIQYRKEMVTLGIAMKGGFLASDQFGGCDLTILRNGAGHIMGAHVFSSPLCRACIAAPHAQWTVIGTWASTGYQAKWHTTGLWAFAFIEGAAVWVVAVGTTGQMITNVDPVGPFPL
jgi:hypothetical protein